MEEEFFNIDFQDASKLDIFNLPDIKQQEEVESNPKEEQVKSELKETDETKNETEEVNNNQGEENPTEASEGSPNLSSSIAFTLADNGVLQTLDEERLKKITNTEELVEAFREDLKNQLTEQQQRVTNALNVGLEPSKIQQYEQIINNLDNVTDETIETEGEQYENYRKNLIYQHYITKGFDENEAKEMVERSVEGGKDIDDAKKALSSLRNFYRKAYDDEIDAGKKAQEEYIKQQKKQIKELESSIIDDDDFYNPLEVSKIVRKKIFETVTKPIKQKDGTQLTTIQQYMREKPNEALKMFGTLYVLTDGFTKFDGIFKGAVRRQVRESNRNLERLLNQMSPIDGSLQFRSGVGENKIDNTKMLDFALD